MKKRIQVVGCIMHHGDSILLLHRSESETDPSLWGIPAGKVEQGESSDEAIVRELKEETGIELLKYDVEHIGQLDIEYEALIVEFIVFYKKFDDAPSIKLDPNEHTTHRWITPTEALRLDNLMLDVDKIIEEFCVKKLGI